MNLIHQEPLEKISGLVRRHLPHAPARALELLPHIRCDHERRSLASSIAHTWSRVDINAAWNTVAGSKLNAADKQLMYNELWG